MSKWAACVFQLILDAFLVWFSSFCRNLGLRTAWLIGRMMPVDLPGKHHLFSSTGVKKGDRVSIYMPMIIELVIAMLACARIGALHSIVVGTSGVSFVMNSLLKWIAVAIDSDSNKAGFSI